MKRIAKTEFIHLNKVDYVIGMLKQLRDKAAKIYQIEDIQLLFKQTGRNEITAIFYLMERVKDES